MKIRYYIKGIKDKDLIPNEKRGGYLFIEHHKINRFEKINSINNISENVLFDFEFNKISKASRLYKESEVTHEIKILDKQEYLPEIIYLKPNIIQKSRLYLNNRKTTDWIKNKISKYIEYIIIGIISSFITLAFSYRNNKVKNEENIETIKMSIKRELLLDLKDSSLKSHEIFIKDSTEINKNKVQ